MRINRYCLAVLLIAALCSCTQNRRSEWDTLDYTGVYQANRGYENDSRYSQPSVLSCIDEDLYNCH